MKTIIALFLVSTLLLGSCNGSNYSGEKYNYNTAKQLAQLSNQISNDSLLYNIEQKILNSFIQGMIKQSGEELKSIEQSIISLNKDRKNSIVDYWYAYACYYNSILYVSLKDAKQAEKILDQGIEKLEEVEMKTSEHYALLALMESFSIQFAAGIRAPFISSSVKKSAGKALELDSLNLRAHFVLGSSDYYTPEQYGGGKKAENYLKKAISLESQAAKNPFLPSWGKNQAYELLIKLYLRQKRYDDAKKVFQQAIALFPSDYMLNKLAAEILKH